MEYSVIIRQAPDGYFIASCPVIPEAKAQGKTHFACMANIKEAIVLANNAAGLVCEEVGIVPIYKKDLVNSFGG